MLVPKGSEEPPLLVSARWLQQQEFVVELVGVVKALHIVANGTKAVLVAFARLSLTTAKLVAVVVGAFFSGGSMVREVGPGLKPQERHEFENHYRDRAGGGWL